uniref:Uncharacterized protein n=1 Tax=Kalanchoe fedtschenkoi TaxID=63787 RepID=A0A7N0U8C7_KALFE
MNKTFTRRWKSFYCFLTISNKRYTLELSLELRPLGCSRKPTANTLHSLVRWMRDDKQGQVMLRSSANSWVR